MQVAKLELCKELFELSGWSTTEKVWFLSANNPTGSLWRNGELVQDGIECFAAYDAGFLLRKLPDGVSLYKGRRGWTLNSGNTFQLNNISTGNLLRLGNFLSAVPEDALCKLAIELFKQGILKKESNQ